MGIAGEIGGAPGGAVADAAKSAFVDGLGVAAVAGALVVFVAAVGSWFLLPTGATVPPGATPGDPEDGAAGDLVDEGILEPSPVID